MPIERGHLEHDIWDRITQTGEPGQDRTVRTGQLGQDSLNRTVLTGRPDRSAWTGEPEKDMLKNAYAR